MEKNTTIDLRYRDIPKVAYDLGLELVSYLESCRIGHFGLGGQHPSKVENYRNRDIAKKKKFFDVPQDDGDHTDPDYPSVRRVGSEDSIANMTFPTTRFYTSEIMIDDLNLVDFIQRNLYQLEVCRVNIRRLPRWDSKIHKDTAKKIRAFFPEETEQVIQIAIHLNIDEFDDIMAFDRAILNHYRLKEQWLELDSSMFIANYDQKTAELISLIGFNGIFILQDLSERGMVIDNAIKNDYSTVYTRKSGKNSFTNRSDYSIFFYTELKNLCLYEI